MIILGIPVTPLDFFPGATILTGFVTITGLVKLLLRLFDEVGFLFIFAVYY